MTDFEVIPDEERDRPQPGVLSPTTIALREGKTIFVPLNGRKVESLRQALNSSARAGGYRLASRHVDRDGVDGLVVWYSGSRSHER